MLHVKVQQFFAMLSQFRLIVMYTELIINRMNLRFYRMHTPFGGKTKM